jgi:hypothetical protein
LRALVIHGDRVVETRDGIEPPNKVFADPPIFFMVPRHLLNRQQYATNYAIAFSITTTIILSCKVSFMSTESGNSGARPIKNCGESSDNFSDETRLEKIDYLRKSLAKNTYHVSTADLACKIIEHMRQVD